MTFKCHGIIDLLKCTVFVCYGGYVCRRRDRCGGQSVNCGRGGSGLLVPVHIVLVLVLVQVLVHIAAPGSGVASQGCSALLHRTSALCFCINLSALTSNSGEQNTDRGGGLWSTSKPSHLPNLPTAVFHTDSSVQSISSWQALPSAFAINTFSTLFRRG